MPRIPTYLPPLHSPTTSIPQHGRDAFDSNLQRNASKTEGEKFFGLHDTLIKSHRFCSDASQPHTPHAGAATSCLLETTSALQKPKKQHSTPSNPDSSPENNPQKVMKHVRGDSFAHIDEFVASKVLEDLLKENDVMMGGSSMGKGLARAARFYLKRQKEQTISEQGDEDLFEETYQPVPEDPFYIVDLGVVVSQVYQWRKCLPRVEPFYAVKSNPDPVIVRTLAILGCSFDCASRKEIEIVQQESKGLAKKPDIIYANPCKGRGHVADAIRRGVRLMTFDNVPEVEKCALVSKKIQLIMRIITDDRGSQCRLSSKFGAPKHKWRPLLQACKDNGLECVGVSFHVGSGCRDASRYGAALRDARAVFDLAESEYGFKMTVVDIGGGFPGETHSMWNPAEHIDPEAEEKVVDLDDDEVAKDEGKGASSEVSTASDGDHFLFFSEIAELISPLIDELFPEEHIRVIGEPGRYLVAASHTLVASVIGQRNNAVDDSFVPEAYNDKEAAAFMNEMTRDEEKNIVRARGMSFSADMDQSAKMMEAIVGEFNDYSKLFAKQHLAQQESDVYNDGLDFYAENFATASDMLGPPEAGPHTLVHTAEGVNVALATDNEDAGDAMMALAAAGEAAVKGVVLQAVADVAPLQDDYAYYINDGTYGAFNNIMFDHATVRPRHLKSVLLEDQELYSKEDSRGSSGDLSGGKNLYASTVFGPTCDSIDVIARSVLLPRLQVGDWLYFQNMGAYTSAAASAFNGFQPSPKFYTCSVKTKFFEQLIAGPDNAHAGVSSEEKKEE